MEHIIGSILVWFIVGFLFQLLRYPKKEIKLSTVKISDPPSPCREDKIITFWVTWALLGTYGICIYLHIVGINLHILG
ncbi:MAG: hypothetical protein KAW92_10695 [Candidatus Cloacimonetes bacterium]|nr:hypothetical protein [Candidatus Cloacimonadota bacterium]